MADKAELSIVIEAINKASKQLKQVESDLRGVSTATQKQGSEAVKSAGGFSKLALAFGLGNIYATIAKKAFDVLTNSIRDLTDYIETAIGISSEYERSLTGLSLISGKFGESQDEATEAAKTLASDGLISLSTAADGLQKLMQGGLSLDQAIELMRNYKDEAAFGRAQTIEYDQAVRNLAESFYTENSMIGNLSGQTENWNILLERGAELLGKNVSSLTKTERAQAKYLAQQELSLLTTGDAIRYADTYAGKLSRLETSYEVLSSTIGDVFKPALTEIKSIQGEVVRSLIEWAEENENKLRAIAEKFSNMARKVIADLRNFLKRNSENIYIAINFIISSFQRLIASWRLVINSIQIIINGFEILANNLIATGKIIYRALKGDWEGVTKAGEDWLTRTGQIITAFKGNLKDIESAAKQHRDSYTFDLKSWWDGIVGIDEKAREEILTNAKKNNEALSDEQKKALNKAAEENEKYYKQVKQRNEDFQEQFDDLIIKHRDTMEQLTQDIAEENREYQKKIFDLKKGFDEAMKDIEDRHAEKTEKIKDDMEDEREKAEEEINKLRKAYEEQYSLIEGEGEDRLANLKTQLEREKALGSNADIEKINSIEEMVKREEEKLAQALQDKKDKHQEEVDDVNEKLDEKLIDLEKQLEKEQKAYQDNLDLTKERHEEDLASATETYQKKLTKLEESLSEEQAIREKYAEDFERLADKIADDDITRLVKKHQKEMARMEDDHNDRLAKIKGDAFDEGKVFNESYGSGLEDSYQSVKNQLDTMNRDLDKTIGKANELMNITGGGGFGKVGDYYTPSNYPGDYPYYGQMGGIFSKPTIVGEAGPEVVLPLDFPNRMASIMKGAGLSGNNGQQVTQNFYVTVQSNQDVDMMMERAGFAMEQGGGYD
jgi:hypothetical protein